MPRERRWGRWPILRYSAGRRTARQTGWPDDGGTDANRTFHSGADDCALLRGFRFRRRICAAAGERSLRVGSYAATTAFRSSPSGSCTGSRTAARAPCRSHRTCVIRRTARGSRSVTRSGLPARASATTSSCPPIRSTRSAHGSRTAADGAPHGRRREPRGAHELPGAVRGGAARHRDVDLEPPLSGRR